jgi:hypothetical protein
MRIQQIQDKILENNNLMKSLQNQVSQLSRENSELAHKREMKLIEYFKDYIELGTSYKVTSWMYLSGVQTNIKKDDKTYSPNFQTNDVFEFVKKNAKSIVIKCTSKIQSTYDKGIRQDKIISPGWIFRVETLNLYQSLLKDPNFAEPFKKYVGRKEALDMLGI